MLTLPANKETYATKVARENLKSAESRLVGLAAQVVAAEQAGDEEREQAARVAYQNQQERVDRAFARLDKLVAEIKAIKDPFELLFPDICGANRGN